MSNSKRGRPKGSGVDDSDVLNRIAELILANSSLKPTTAIKKLGIYDDSIIRRLREKWKLSKGELLSVATTKVVRHRSNPNPSQYVGGLGEATKSIGLRLSEAFSSFGGSSIGLQAAAEMLGTGPTNLSQFVGGVVPTLAEATGHDSRTLLSSLNEQPNSLSAQIEKVAGLRSYTSLTEAARFVTGR